MDIMINTWPQILMMIMILWEGICVVLRANVVSIGRNVMVTWAVIAVLRCATIFGVLYWGGFWS